MVTIQVSWLGRAVVSAQQLDRSTGLAPCLGGLIAWAVGPPRAHWLGSLSGWGQRQCSALGGVADFLPCMGRL